MCTKNQHMKFYILETKLKKIIQMRCCGATCKMSHPQLTTKCYTRLWNMCVTQNVVNGLITILNRTAAAKKENLYFERC